MLHILRIGVRQIIHACIRNSKQMSNTVFRKIIFQIGTDIGCYWKFFLFHFLEKKISELYLCFIVRE